MKADGKQQKRKGLEVCLGANRSDTTKKEVILLMNWILHYNIF